MSERGSYAKGVAKREEILLVALEVFARSGYRGTSLREIAKAAGLSLPGLMHYFDSKEDLLTSVLSERDHLDYELVLGELGELGAADPIDGFIAVMRHNADVPGLVQLYSTLAAAASDPEHPSHVYFKERFAAFRAQFVEMVREGIAAGTLPDDLDPLMTASSFLALADGLQLQWMVDPTIDMAAHIEYFWGVLTRRV